MSSMPAIRNSPPRLPSAGIAVALAIAVFAASPIAASGEGSTIDFVSGPDATDLVCPSASVRPPQLPTTPEIPAAPQAQMPSLAELGDLARPVVRPQPPLDAARAPDFALLDGATGSPRRRSFAFWGDSHIAAGPFMGQLVQAIRDRGETVGPRFLPPTMGRSNVRLPIRAYCIGQSWSTALSYTAPDTLRTGPALANRSAPAGPDSFLWLDLRNADRQPTIRQLQIVYRPSELETELGVSVNDGVEQRIVLPSAGFDTAASSRILTIRGDALISTVKLHVETGYFVLFGFILDYEAPPRVIFDVFGLPSSEAVGWANADPNYLAQSLHGVSYDAVALEYGTNEGNVAHFDRDNYAASLTRALTNLRHVFPTASCLLIGPPDRGILVPPREARRTRPDLLHFAKIHQEIAAVQSEVAEKFGCVAWNWQDLMGGPGGSYGWAHNVPPLMGRDLTHMTSEGYKRTGAALATSLGWESPSTP
jgi:lysophospholipase L1-like esterase